eukprot:740163-Pyramimonas_sp.AAC.1
MLAGRLRWRNRTTILTWGTPKQIIAGTNGLGLDEGFEQRRAIPRIPPPPLGTRDLRFCSAAFPTLDSVPTS